MNDSSLKTYGFEYKYEGSSFVFHIVASSAEEAKKRALAMASAQFIGELHSADEENGAKKPAGAGVEDVMLDNELLFELRSQSGEVWKLYLNGVVEGFPLGTVVENRAFPLWCALAGEIRKQAAITIGAQ